MVTFQICAITTYGESSSSTYWHRKTARTLIFYPCEGLKDRNGNPLGVAVEGDRKVIAGKCVGLEGQCTAFYLADRRGNEVKLYTMTPTNEGTVEGIKASLHAKGIL